MALESSEVLILLGLLAIAVVGAVMWVSRRGESRALVAARDEAQRSIERVNRQLEQVEADRAELARQREDVERRETRLAERSDRQIGRAHV